MIHLLVFQTSADEAFKLGGSISTADGAPQAGVAIHRTGADPDNEEDPFPLAAGA